MAFAKLCLLNSCCPLLLNTAPLRQQPFKPCSRSHFRLVPAASSDSKAASLLSRIKGLKSKPKSSISTSLISVLKDELKFEKEQYRKEEMLFDDPPSDFVLVDEPGKSSFFLTKQHEQEKILIKIGLDSQSGGGDLEEDEYEMMEDEQDEPVEFQVNVAKRDHVLIFDCESNGENLTINHVAFESTADNEDEDALLLPPYTGPVFDELDDTLQQAFIDFLEERGVNAELGEYLRLYAVDKLALEYQAWLGKVKDFIAG